MARLTDRTGDQRSFLEGPKHTVSGDIYSGDKPNPALRSFIERHLGASSDEVDPYTVGSFGEVLHVANRRSPLNDLHIYWSKKPYEAVQAYIRHYTKPGDLVLDPFCGSGGTVLCSCLEGCAAIGIDLSPAATFITKYYCTPVDLDEVAAAFSEVDQLVGATLGHLYESRGNHGESAQIAYTVWSTLFRCARCRFVVPLGACPEVPAFNKDGSPRRTRTGEQATCYVCPYCFESGNQEPIDTGSQRYGRIPLRVSILVEAGRKQRRSERAYTHPSRTTDPREFRLEALTQGNHGAARFDLERLLEIEREQIPHNYPTTRMMHSPPETPL